MSEQGACRMRGEREARTSDGPRRRCLVRTCTLHHLCGVSVHTLAMQATHSAARIAIERQRERARATSTTHIRKIKTPNYVSIRYQYMQFNYYVVYKYSWATARYAGYTAVS